MFVDGYMGAFTYVTAKAAQAAAEAIKRACDANARLLAQIRATVDPRKFSEYIFKEGSAPGKAIVFEDLGYGVQDSKLLSAIYEQQAAAKYAAGEYTLGTLDGYGQRINIEIKLNGIGDYSNKTSYIKSGWMINADGSISLNTPFSGFTQ
jgi:filamentous hemagglutinin